jgi:hypothetical protein
MDCKLETHPPIVLQSRHMAVAISLHLFTRAREEGSLKNARLRGFMVEMD